MSADDTIKVTGPIPAGRFAVAPATTAPGILGLDCPVYEFDTVTAQAAEFDLDEVRVHVAGSEFDRCVFRQDLKLAKAHRKNFGYSHSFVLYGVERSIYRDCTFDHVDFGIRGGGAHPGDARFEG